MEYQECQEWHKAALLKFPTTHWTLLGNEIEEIPPHLRVHCSLNHMSTRSVASFADRFEENAECLPLEFQECHSRLFQQHSGIKTFIQTWESKRNTVAHSARHSTAFSRFWVFAARFARRRWLWMSRENDSAKCGRRRITFEEVLYMRRKRSLGHWGQGKKKRARSKSRLPSKAMCEYSLFTRSKPLNMVF